MADDIRVSAIFCDDIRQEVGGKHSFMGVYGPECVLKTLPGTIPRLCIAIIAIMSPGSDISDISAEMLGPDGNLQAFPVTMDASHLRLANRDLPLQVNLILIGGAVEVKEASKLSVSIKINGTNFEAGELYFRQATETETT